MTSPLRRTLLSLLIIPLLGLLASSHASQRLQRQWSLAHPTDTRSLGELCAGQAEAICHAYQPLPMLQQLALLLLGGAMLLGVILAVMPRLRAAPRAWLLRHHQVLAWVGQGTVLILVIGRACLLVGLVAYLPQAWWGKPAAGPAVLLALVALLGVVKHIKLSGSLLHAPRPRLVGKRLTADDWPACHAWVQARCTALHLEMPHHLVLGWKPECRLHAADAALEPDQQRLRGSVLYLGAPLLIALDQAQGTTVLDQQLQRLDSRHGHGLPEVEDQWASAQSWAEVWLRQHGNQRLNRTALPALQFRLAWLHALHQVLHTPDMPHQNPHPAVSSLDSAVQDAMQHLVTQWAMQVQTRFKIAIGNGSECPPLMTWLLEARHAAGDISHAWLLPDPQIQNELTQREREWLIDSGQAVAPNDSWELRGSNRWANASL